MIRASFLDLTPKKYGVRPVLLLLLMVMAQWYVEIIQSRLPTFKYQIELVEIKGK